MDGQRSALVRSKYGRESSMGCRRLRFRGDDKMQVLVDVVVGWIVLSCTVGPLLAWAFFYRERRIQAMEAAHDHWIATHPAAPRELMPTWFGAVDNRDSENELTGVPEARARRR